MIHWSHGFHTVLVTTVIGALFMMVYLRTRSLVVPVAAHFIVNFIAYSGVVPLGWFQIF
jgi:membrane protease YdiL (CAAX protease family)